jgi:PAS domain S-box-containing protein
MNHSIHRKEVPPASPFPIPMVGRFDRFALYATTAVVLFFAVYPFLFFRERSSLSVFGAGRRMTLDDFLTIMLSLEAFLVFWLWREMPRRHKAESSLKKIHSLQRAISEASGRIVSMKREELEQGLQRELCAIREMLRIDRASWFQQTEDGTKFIRMQSSSAADALPLPNEIALAELPWIADRVLLGAPVHIRNIKDLPPQALAERWLLQRNEIKSMAFVPSNGGSGADALVLTSFTKEITWEEEVIAQLSVLASVFANAQSRKAAQDESHASELRFRHLLDDSPIGVALLDPNAQVRMANARLGQFLARSREELHFDNILELIHPDDVSQTWLHLRELLAGVGEIAHSEMRFLRKDKSIVWGRMTISLAGTKVGNGPLLLCMIEDVTETKEARELLERSRRMLTLALESSRSIAWEYDIQTDTISWLDRHILHDSEERVPARDSFTRVLAHVAPEDREGLCGLRDQVLKSGGAFSTEFRMFAEDGGVRWMLVKGELQRKRCEHDPRFVGVAIDVSEMKRAQLQLQELAKRLMQAQEEERKHISRELHDDIGQRVALLGMELDIARRLICHEDTLRAKLEQLHASVSELGTDLHHISHGLHSSKLKHLGLDSALRELCQRISNGPSLQVELHCSGQTNMLSEGEALVLFRIAQEGLNNVVRHSNANRATVTLRCSEPKAELTIWDNGCGFDLQKQSGGIGLLGMRERLRAVNGRLQILSDRKSGTELHATVPVGAVATATDVTRHISGVDRRSVARAYKG